MTGLTRQLGEIISAISFDRLPAQAVETAKRGAIDCVGVMFAGRDEPVVGIARELLRPDGGRGEARVLFDRGSASSTDAALVNATAGHALDYDDTAMDGHPSVVLVPAVLAEGERLGARGAELIAAYVAGYETWAELTWRDADRHHGKGWHPTAVFGTLAAAAAASALARLDAGRAASALGIAASMAAGLVANFGSMMKPFQVGRAVQNGLLAARLAAAGMSASPDALEHPIGFLHAVSPSGRVRLDGDIQAGRDWHILRHGINIKRYPVCYGIHRAIDAVLGVAGRAQRPLAAADIVEIEVTLGRVQAGMLRQHSPRTALDAKFSAEFAMACAILAGRVGMAELNDAFVADAAVQSLMRKVRVESVEASDPDDPLFSPADSVRIRLREGGMLESEPVRRARGHAHNPIDVEDLRAKFTDCVGGALATEARERLFGRLLHLETLPNTGALYDA